MAARPRPADLAAVLPLPLPRCLRQCPLVRPLLPRAQARPQRQRHRAPPCPQRTARYRQTHRPGHHETPLGTYDPPDTGVTIAFLEAQLQALKAMLTPREQRYLRQELLGEPTPAEPCAFSAAHAEKLRQRVRVKLCGLL